MKLVAHSALPTENKLQEQPGHAYLDVDIFEHHSEETAVFREKYGPIGAAVGRPRGAGHPAAVEGQTLLKKKKRDRKSKLVCAPEGKTRRHSLFVPSCLRSFAIFSLVTASARKAGAADGRKKSTKGSRAQDTEKTSSFRTK